MCGHLRIFRCFSTISVRFQYNLISCVAIKINHFQKFAWQLNQGQLNTSPPQYSSRTMCTVIAGCAPPALGRWVTWPYMLVAGLACTKQNKTKQTRTHTAPHPSYSLVAPHMATPPSPWLAPATGGRQPGKHKAPGPMASESSSRMCALRVACIPE